MVLRKKKNKNLAFFLDRDGVINHEIGYIKKWTDIKFYNKTLEALKTIQKAGFLIIVITNQSIIARKIIKRKKLLILNEKFIHFFKKRGVIIKKIYFCPHHPKFTGICKCRKPKNGLILKAKKQFNIDLKNSWLVGDKTSDIKTGKVSGINTILVKTGYGGLDNNYKVKPDYTFKNLYNAVNEILNK